MSKGEFTPKNNEVEFGTLRDIYAKSAAVFADYSGDNLLAEFGEGARTKKYNLLEIAEGSGLTRDEAWLEHEIFYDDSFKHLIYRLCRYTASTIDEAKVFSSTVYNVDVHVHRRRSTAVFLPHISRYECAQILTKDSDIYADTSGFLVPTKLIDGRRVILPPPKNIDQGKITLGDAEEIQQLLSVIENRQKNPKKYQLKGRAVVNLVRD